MQGILQAPRFLYRVEIGTGEKVSDTAVKLSPVRARGALVVFGLGLAARRQADAMPRARARSPAKKASSAQLEWMLQDAKGKTMVRRFLESWMHLPDLDDSDQGRHAVPAVEQARTLKASMQGPGQRLLR